MTGGVRDSAAGKGWWHLLPFYPLMRLAQWYELGATKYGKNNYKKGLPLSWYLDSAFRHLAKLADVEYLAGEEDREDHAAAAMWNVASFIWTKNEIDAGRLPAELDDLREK